MRKSAVDYALPLLPEVLTSDSEPAGTRMHAVMALAQVLKEDPTVPESSVMKARELASLDGVLPLLQSMLQASDYATRRSAVEVLCEARQANFSRVEPLFKMALVDESSSLHRIAAEGLRRMGPADLSDMLPFLEERLGGEQSWTVRRELVMSLGQMNASNPKEVLQLLLKAFKDQDRDVRAEAVEALGRVGFADPNTALPILADALNTSFDLMRVKAVKGLVYMGSTSPIQVMAILRDVRDSDCQAAVKALGGLDSPDGNPDGMLLLAYKALNSTDAPLRANATRALGELASRDPDAVVLLVLQRALADGSTDVRKAAVQALTHLGSVDPKGVSLAYLGVVLKYLGTAIPKKPQNF